MSRLSDIYKAAKERKAASENGQKIPPELILSEDAYLTRSEVVEVFELKQALPTFGELQKQARERLKDRVKRRKNHEFIFFFLIWPNLNFCRSL